jgi:TPP-dependent pyruvate/acetoin dehydrogenase alpha subunit
MSENKPPAPMLIEKRGVSSKPDSPLSPEQLRELYYYLQLNRQLETRLERLFRQAKIVGGLYSSLGQEAISVGAAYALEARDWLAPMIRNIGALLVKKVPPRDIFTQHMARETSPTHGKDGTSHFADLNNRHIVAPSSMLGDLIPVLTGVAMAGRYLGQNIVALTFIGDGGSSTGAFHEGMNLASSQRAPLVVILENNQWAYSTPCSRQATLRDFAERAKAYGIPSAIVDGNDVLAVYRAAKQAVDQCRTGRGPWLIEAKTMRMKGHAQHDGADYVPKEMVDYWKASDPIDRCAKFLAEHGLLDEAQKSEINARIERELDAEQEFAEASPFPAPESAAESVYCEGCHTIETEWKRPKSEVTPPATATEPAWKITDFGAARSGNADLSTGGGKSAGSNRRRAPEQDHGADESVAWTNEAPLRVPFGRGPKDRAFAKEQPPPRPPQQQNRPQKPNRHASPASRKDHKRKH